MNNFAEAIGVASPAENAVALLYKGGQYRELDSIVDPALGIHFTNPVAINDSRQIAVIGKASDQTTHTYLLNQAVAGFQPDLIIGAGGSAIGRNIFNATGAGQSISFTLKKGRSKNISIQGIYGGKTSDTITLKGSGSSKQFPVQYLIGQADITTSVKSGKFKIAKLDPSESQKHQR